MNILVVDDEEAMREVLRERLEAWGFQVHLAADAGEGEARAAETRPDVVISDVVMPDASGLDLLRKLQAGDPQRPVLLITAHGTVEMAVEAIKEGAQDFLTKPLDYENLHSLLDNLRRQASERRRTDSLNADLAGGKKRLGELVGGSKAMREVYALLREVAGTDAPVLVTGESGTGKELTARILHERSPRAGKELVAVNTAAIPQELVESELFGHERGAFTGAVNMRRGCFELAHEGTLFLDEIAEMPLHLQPKLLRVLEDGRVRRLGGSQEMRFDVRLVAATNRDPREAIRDGCLREDLYYRLNVFHVHLPALRERPEDLPLLTQHFLAKCNEKHGMEVEGFREEVLDNLRDYHWPGNVRELRNLVERAVVLAKTGWVELSHLPPYLREPGRAPRTLELEVGTPLEEAEKEMILKTLEQTGQNKAETARRLGVDVKTIRNKLKAYGLS
jgi:DNA-binding NtrC family response regulator